MNILTKQDAKDLIGDGWTKEQIKNGYDVFCEGGSDTIPNVSIMCRIDVVGKFESDWDACRQAEKDGIIFINDIKGLEKGCYIDTKENRKLCIDTLEKCPELRIENLMKDDIQEYWKDYKDYFKI